KGSPFVYANVGIARFFLTDGANATGAAFRIYQQGIIRGKENLVVDALSRRFEGVDASCALISSVHPAWMIQVATSYDSDSKDLISQGILDSSSAFQF
ncbi:LOW QUALITY PROTEIN: hypothetical protein V2J09_004222, partial [Rumex salicifolius]